jgi:threonine dehydrogenase-like Zn-dependent dehydrogenase
MKISHEGSGKIVEVAVKAGWKEGTRYRMPMMGLLL